MSKVHQTTPLANLVERFPHKLGLVVQLPLLDNYHYGIAELSKLSSLGFPPAAPRVYWVRDVSWAGNHAHKIGSETELMICLAGRMDIHLWDREGNYLRRQMDPAKFPGMQDEAVLVPDGVWHLVTAEPNSLLLVIASVVYSREYYITDPEEYFTPEGLMLYHGTLPERPE